MTHHISPPQTTVAHPVPHPGEPSWNVPPPEAALVRIPRPPAVRTSQALTPVAGRVPTPSGRRTRRETRSLPDGTPITVYVEQPRIDWSRTSVRVVAIVVPILALIVFILFLLANLANSIGSAASGHGRLIVVCLTIGFIALLLIRRTTRVVKSVTTIAISILIHRER